MSNITLASVIYYGRGLVNGRASWLSTGSVPRLFRKLAAAVNIGPNVATTRWAASLPVQPVEGDPACPCPGEQPMRDTQIEVIVRTDSRADKVHRDAVLLTIQDLVLKTEFTASVTDLVQPIG